MSYKLLYNHKTGYFRESYSLSDLKNDMVARNITFDYFERIYNNQQVVDQLKIELIEYGKNYDDATVKRVGNTPSNFEQLQHKQQFDELLKIDKYCAIYYLITLKKENLLKDSYNKIQEENQNQLQKQQNIDRRFFQFKQSILIQSFNKDIYTEQELQNFIALLGNELRDIKSISIEQIEQKFLEKPNILPEYLEINKNIKKFYLLNASKDFKPKSVDTTQSQPKQISKDQIDEQIKTYKLSIKELIDTQNTPQIQQFIQKGVIRNCLELSVLKEMLSKMKSNLDEQQLSAISSNNYLLAYFIRQQDESFSFHYDNTKLQLFKQKFVGDYEQNIFLSIQEYEKLSDKEQQQISDFAAQNMKITYDQEIINKIINNNLKESSQIILQFENYKNIQTLYLSKTIGIEQFNQIYQKYQQIETKNLDEFKVKLQNNIYNAEDLKDNPFTQFIEQIHDDMQSLCKNETLLQIPQFTLLLDQLQQQDKIYAEQNLCNHSCLLMSYLNNKIQNFQEQIQLILNPPQEKQPDKEEQPAEIATQNEDNKIDDNKQTTADQEIPIIDQKAIIDEVKTMDETNNILVEQDKVDDEKLIVEQEPKQDVETDINIIQNNITTVAQIEPENQDNTITDNLTVVQTANIDQVNDNQNTISAENKQNQEQPNESEVKVDEKVISEPQISFEEMLLSEKLTEDDLNNESNKIAISDIVTSVKTSKYANLQDQIVLNKIIEEKNLNQTYCLLLNANCYQLQLHYLNNKLNQELFSLYQKTEQSLFENKIMNMEITEQDVKNEGNQKFFQLIERELQQNQMSAFLNDKVLNQMIEIQNDQKLIQYCQIIKSQNYLLFYFLYKKNVDQFVSDYKVAEKQINEPSSKPEPQSVDIIPTSKQLTESEIQFVNTFEQQIKLQNLKINDKIIDKSFSDNLKTIIEQEKLAKTANNVVDDVLLQQCNEQIQNKQFQHTIMSTSVVEKYDNMINQLNDANKEQQ